MMFRASEYDKALHDKACALAASILALRETVASSIDNPASDKATIGQQLDHAIATAKKYIEAVVATLDDKKQFDKPLRECQQALKASTEGVSTSASSRSVIASPLSRNKFIRSIHYIFTKPDEYLK